MGGLLKRRLGPTSRNHPLASFKESKKIARAPHTGYVAAHRGLLALIWEGWLHAKGIDTVADAEPVGS